jgi:outer membrane receptor protein involved in Fe transport
MKCLKLILSTITLLITTLNFAQENAQSNKVKISGKVVDKVTNQPLEYTTITVQNVANSSDITGGITNNKGEFEFDVDLGVYDIKIEFIPYKVIEIKQKKIVSAFNLGTISLSEDVTQLKEIVIRNEKTTVEIKLDKKVYNVGNDIMVKGGTVSDVLDNIPSVSVDADGAVSLRGNADVRILIDGKPSNAINIAEALRQIPADAIDKVEVITNPSARYDSEGGGGLLNIILKKGKNQGLNGIFILSSGYPENYGASGNLNYKSEKFNLFTTNGYNYRKNPGRSLTNTEYLNADGSTKNYIDERRNNDRISEGYNGNFGIDLFLNKSTTWTNGITYRKNGGDNPETVSFTNYDANRAFQSINYRYNLQNSQSENVEYNTNFVKKFKRDGHKFSIDASFSSNNEYENAFITDIINEKTINDQKQGRNIIQSDYVLPFGKSSQFEFGYKGDFNNLTTAYEVGSVSVTGVYSPYANFTNTLQYKEKVNALYSQLGTKVGKFSFLFGLRWEDSNIDINLLTTNDFNKKRYNNFFPSAFVTYEFSKQTSVSISYSRRISRPRGRQINPFSNYSSNINVFQGNPNLNPAMTDAIDFGFLKKWDKLTLNTSTYFNKTINSFQPVRRQPDVLSPLIITTPINLATEYRFGFEFTLNYSPYKWWKLNSNFNFFRNQTNGDFVYTNANDQVITQNFDNTAYSWFTRLTSKITLPYKIDWQTNMTYNGPQNNAQGKSLGVYSANLGFSKDILKDKGTLALNVQDVFNSRKRINQTNLPKLNSYSEMQWRMRQINISFTYRFNKKKSDREKPKREGGDDNDFQG